MEATAEREAKLARAEVKRLSEAAAHTSAARTPRPSSAAAVAERREFEKRDAKSRAELNAAKVHSFASAPPP